MQAGLPVGDGDSRRSAAVRTYATAELAEHDRIGRAQGLDSENDVLG
jgi:hypothetical protein